MVEIRKLITIREMGPLGPRGHGDAAGCARGCVIFNPSPGALSTISDRSSKQARNSAGA